jgi:hypothetical protein
MRDKAFAELDRIARGKMRPFGTVKAGQFGVIFEINSGRARLLE